MDKCPSEVFVCTCHGVLLCNKATDAMAGSVAQDKFDLGRKDLGLKETLEVAFIVLRPDI